MTSTGCDRVHASQRRCVSMVLRLRQDEEGELHILAQSRAAFSCVLSMVQSSVVGKPVDLLLLPLRHPSTSRTFSHIACAYLGWNSELVRREKPF